jgi:hypothetical protein
MSDCPPVGDTTQPQPTDDGPAWFTRVVEPIHRFGLTLTKADFDKLEAALEVINEAERRALAGPDYVTAVAQIRALHQKSAPHHIWHDHCVTCDEPWPCRTIRALDEAGCP